MEGFIVIIIIISRNERPTAYNTTQTDKNRYNIKIQKIQAQHRKNKLT